MKIWKTILFTIIGLIIFSPSLWADIFYYKDETGTLHFTNAPESQNEYKVFRRNAFKNWQASTYDQTRYESVILEAARRYDIDHTLIKAVIKAESNFDPRAVSPKGARGLMQIMPDNFRTLGVYNPFDPRQNIMGGTRYLRLLFNQFDSLTLALAAYNAGPTAVSTYNNVPPYKETQQYVQRVLQYYRSYNGFQ
ncbi:MAG: lytic transglycosylase domain-containing protein [Candidatus Magnetomorum sp.]|nr:lytic transglycosylase domain-containing protein [Candidatus Magnetomorum sp.]